MANHSRKHSHQNHKLHEIPVTVLKGVGAQLASKLAKMGVYTLQDLLFHLPLRYSDRTRITPIGELQPGQAVVIEGEVQSCSVAYGKRRSLMCRLRDTTGMITLRFYHFSGAQKEGLAVGTRLRCFGETRRGASGLECYHPEYQHLDKHVTELPLEQTLTPVYPATEGITQPRLRQLIVQAEQLITEHNLPDLLPEALAQHAPQLSLQQRLHYLHHPPKEASIDQLLEGTHPYQQQLIFEELATYQLSLLRLRQRRQALAAQPLQVRSTPKDAFIQSLAFTLTHAQQRVADEIAADMSKATPMMRLVQGDVGSGKTVVAALAALQAVHHGYQVAIMAPTEILAEQHRHSFEQWFSPLGVTIGWLSGRQRVGERRDNLQKIMAGDVQIVVGTHALFQEDVTFHQLALVVIDEQHRFGVHQRLSLRDKGSHTHTNAQHRLTPHQLIMTATPIPRTLAMSVYADLDYSVIDELPKGRIPVETVVISQQRREAVIERIRYACQNGRQAYWVCTLIEQSESLEAEAAEDAATLLTQQLSGLCVGLIHGRLKSKEKDAVMGAFKQGEIDLLVATTVIEVGVDVPNASLMVIENPERLGLAQLHQLRGRVGRGSRASHCVLLYGDPLSRHSKERLQAMRSTNDGFRIAEIDLKLRGPGEVLGTRQTGDIHFKLANLERDIHILPQVKDTASALIANEQYQPIVDQLIERWLGNNENYANA